LLVCVCRTIDAGKRVEGLLSKIAAVATGLILSAALAACAAVEPSGSVDPTPVAVKAIGRSDSKYNGADDESRRLAGVKGAWRRGEFLTVDTNEGIQYRFVDAGVCEGFYTCRRWIFRGSTQVPDIGQTPQSHPSDYWLIEFEQGEGGYWLAINRESGSSIVLDTQPAVSPDKRRWATGECNEESSNSLKILEGGAFGQMILAAEAADDAPCCDILGWDGGALKVKTCELEPGKAYTDRLVRQADGLWAGKRIRLQKPKAP
jgi:hypothetical protein